MQKSKLMHSVLAIALLAGTVTVSFGAVAAGQSTAAMAAAPEAAATSDAAITASAKSALSADAQIASLPIKVTAQQGVVVVSGEVPSAATSERVLQILASVHGVKDIKNGLKVKSS
jgi:hyperosmotically inducible protein